MSITPFDDSLSPILSIPASSDATVFDPQIDTLRQGVEITNTKYFYLGTQPKMWSGNDDVDLTKPSSYVNHQISVGGLMLGQTLGFTEFDQSATFTDKQEFDPILYINGSDIFPYPILFNDGPKQENEAQLEPLTIPFKLPSNEGPFYAHSVRAEMEQGNNFTDPYYSCNLVEQFIDSVPLVSASFFLDIGSDCIGGIIRDGFVTNTIRETFAFSDERPDRIANSVRTNDSNFSQILISMTGYHSSSGNELLPSKRMSATAGFYAPKMNILGMSSSLAAEGSSTDSIAFSFWSRGY